MSNYGKGIALTCGFDVGTKDLLDNRCQVSTLEELESMSDILRADGLIVYVASEKKPYVWDGVDNAWLPVSMGNDAVDVTIYVEGTPADISKADIPLGAVVTVTGAVNGYYVKTSGGLIEIKNYDTLFEAITEDVTDIKEQTTANTTTLANVQSEVAKISAILANMNLVVPELYDFYITRGTEKLTTQYIATGTDISGGVTLGWSLRQSAVDVTGYVIETINGDVEVDASYTSYTLTGLPSEDQTITIKGKYTKDGLSYTTDALSVTINFMDIVYYGAAVEQAVPTSEFITSLTKTNSYADKEDATSTFTIRVDGEKYFYFCLPYASINSLYLTLNLGVIIANSGIVLVDASGNVSTPYIGNVTDYEGIDVDGVKYAVIRSDRPSIGVLRFSFNII